MPNDEIVMVPIDQVSVLNPRSRNEQQHQEIIDNIETIGLKRPVTVRRHPTLNDRYEVVCGEGRLEAFRRLDQAEIPVVIVDASEEDCLIMGLVENLARRQHRPIDIMADIGNLHQRGYTDNEIAEKIGFTASWVNMVVKLLTNGEERLLAAVESGVIPVSLAVDIARASDAEEQNVLAEAYAQGKLKGKKLGRIRRLLEARRTQRKNVKDSGLGRGAERARKLTPDELLRLYQREAEKQQLIVKRSDFTRSRLLFVVEALRDVVANETFHTLLRAEDLNRMPAWLYEKIAEQAA
ncbi:ParB/RepB/Spo0J family partition protein [Sphingopyxis sp. JAI128]|uniref:ParB/RepB/Spo0J family partition protein n=1 Tax=Sphingopyxis sp. JAI128 TaxID=2723066 RepID=UPI00160D2EC1|nr:plasmid partitioning protein RepB C-terminal domain-containing protein [Sphingopyxis sp. JAI128]MBB6427417.1 ParB family chromosome partitioning protein [Sphingopyxis sp. JAI128]